MQTHKNTNKHWTEEQRQFIRDNYSRMAISEIAEQLGRSPKSTRTQVERMGIRLDSLQRTVAKFWSKNELEIIKDNFTRPINEIRELIPNRTFSSIYEKCRKYGRDKKYKGWHIDGGGYKQIGNGRNSYMAEHRIIITNHIGRKLLRSEIVHHINCDKSDNRIENLYLCKDASSHSTIHHSLQKLLKELMERNIVKFNRNTGEYEL